jgi:hypothetical protein
MKESECYRLRKKKKEKNEKRKRKKKECLQEENEQ